MMRCFRSLTLAVPCIAPHRTARQRAGPRRLIGLAERVADREGAEAAAVGEILGPKNGAAEFEGARNNQRVPPGDLVAPVQFGGPEKVRVARAMDASVSEVCSIIGDRSLTLAARGADVSRDREGAVVRVRERRIINELQRRGVSEARR